MQRYSIKDLERLSGIKAHTLRIWEKRYNIFSPLRTDTNIRYYSNDDIRKLLNIKTLLDSGLKISKISQLTDTELHHKIKEELKKSEPAPYNTYIYEFMDAMLSISEEKFHTLFSSCVLKFGFYETMVQIVYPFLYKVGLLWTIEKVIPLQEHFASCLIKQKLNSAIDGLNVEPNPKPKKFLLFLNQHEEHEIALLFASYIIRSAGHKVVYLGPRVPTDNLIKLKEEFPDFQLLTYLTNQLTEEENEEIFGRLSKELPHKNVYVAGCEELIQKLLHYPGIKFLNSLEDLKSIL